MDANVIANLMAQLVTVALVVYVGLHLRSRLQTLQATVDAQKTTIDAQAEQLKAQSMVLQDFERHVKTMKVVVDTLDSPAMLQRVQSHMALVESMADASVEQRTKQLGEQSLQAVAQVRQAYKEMLSGIASLVGHTLPFVSPALRRALLEAPDLPPFAKDVLQAFAKDLLQDRERAEAQALGQLLAGGVSPQKEETNT